MLITVIIAVLSLVILAVIHEFGHFIVAKFFKVRVDEFGLGYPPRIFGRKFGNTIYSFNWLPFGAFVRIFGEEEDIHDPASFSSKPAWQRMLIVLAGVVSFWLVAILLLTFVMVRGAPTEISDSETEGFVDPKVQIAYVNPHSPAQEGDIRVGDVVLEVSSGERFLKVDTVDPVRNFIRDSAGKEVEVTLKRGNEVLEIKVVPRENPPEGEGPLGIALARTALKSYVWYQAPLEGLKATWNLTMTTLTMWGEIIKGLIWRNPLPVQFVGPIGIVGLFAQATSLGLTHYLVFISVISVYLALFNLLPIPAVDGGKLLFLIIEAVRKKPINQIFVRKIESFFFVALLFLMVLVTFGDIRRLF